ncbi:hypothetical protein SFR_1838 [Streptomyces sp. FR-008]|nr:hypothetical protein SFR_1838 [Streptomyces sp. FR-008]
MPSMSHMTGICFPERAAGRTFVLPAPPLPRRRGRPPPSSVHPRPLDRARRTP